MGTARYYTLGPVDPQFARSSDSRTMIYLASAVGVFCAATMFLLLWARDHSLLLQTGASAIAAVSSPSPTSVPAAPANTTSHPIQAAKEEMPFSVARSRRFHRVGPISVGLWRIDPRHGTFDLSVLAYGHRINRSRMKPEDEILIDSKDPSKVLKLIVKSVDKNGVSGYLVGAS